MAEFSYPFDAVFDEFGEPDRLYNMDDFARERQMLLSNGVFIKPATNLKIDAISGNMSVVVRQGTGFINGHVYGLYDEDKTFIIEPSNNTNPRNDVVLLVLDMIQRKIYLKLVKGIANSSPQDPALIRNSDIWELKLGSIRVNASATQITQANITDTRLDINVCGIVSNLIDSVDTTELYNQYQTALDEFLALSADEQQRQIDEWQEQTDKQQADFESQLTSQDTDWKAQQADYLAWKSSIDSWKDLTTAELAKVITFNMGNQFDYAGTEKVTLFNIDGSITETLKYTSLNKVFAEQSTIFLVDGNIEVTQKVYNTDSSVFRNIKQETIFNLDGSITERVVSL